MKKLNLFSAILILSFIFVSCKDAVLPCESSVEKHAKELLAQADRAYEAGDSHKAKVLMDSIRNSCPRAYKTLCEVEDLYHKVLLDEKKRDIAFYENRLEELYAVRDSLAQGLDYRKDQQYEDYGVYSHPSQSIKENSNNCFMRATVNEQGEGVVTSYYRGKRIGHRKIKVSSGDFFVEVDVENADRAWTGREYGVYVERYGFKTGNDGGIMQFIANAKGKVFVELTGEGTSYKYELRESDAVAVARILELQDVLATIAETRRMLSSAHHALAYLGQGDKSELPADTVNQSN